MIMAKFCLTDKLVSEELFDKSVKLDMQYGENLQITNSYVCLIMILEDTYI